MINLNELIEVKLHDREDFLKIKETLTRIGIPSSKGKTLYQSCHILHKQGRYYIVHFKQMFLLDGKDSSMSEEDTLRLNTIANLLHDWELLDLADEDKYDTDPVPVKIIPFKEKSDWNLIPKYNIGKKKLS